MHCHRCNNLMFPIALQDWGGGLMKKDSPAWRCFACGEIMDQQIRDNRNRDHGSEEARHNRGARHRINAVALQR